jgi:TPR repeat protein
VQPRVFVSHSHKDAEIAGDLVTFLESYGVSCWWSQRDIRPGESWAEKLDQAIDSSDVMLFLLSPHSNRDKHQVLRELEQANNRKIPVLTYRVEDLEPSHGIRFFIHATQFCDAFDRSADDVGNELLHSVKALASGEIQAFGRPSKELRRPPLGPPVGSSSRAGFRHRFRLTSPVALAIMLSLVLILLIIGLLIMKGARKPQDPVAGGPVAAAPSGSAASPTNPPGDSSKQAPPVAPPAPATDAAEPSAATPPPRPGPDPDQELATLEKEAIEGDVSAMVKLATHHAQVTTNYERSMFWSRKAAAKESAEGMFLVGNHYMVGAGVGQDLNAAIEWFEKAKAAGDPRAEINIRMLRQQMGRSTPDDATASNGPDPALLQQAASGDAKSQFDVGVHHLQKGEFNDAEKWIRKSADNGWARAMTEYGNLFYAGMGVEENNDKAIEWWTKGANAGCKVGAHNLKVYRQRLAK